MAAFKIPLRAKPWTKDEAKGAGRLACPVCKESWTPTTGSKLSCHAKCLFSAEALVHILKSPDTHAEIASRYGVTDSVIRSAIKVARELEKETKKTKEASP